MIMLGLGLGLAWIDRNMLLLLIFCRLQDVTAKTCSKSNTDFLDVSRVTGCT